jgi:signal peptidase II
MTRAVLICLIAATVVADQLTKAAALSALSQGIAVPVFPGFNLTLGFNEGASFGMMGGVMAGKPLLMAALTGALTLAFAVMAFRAQHPLERIGYGLVAGGALGNIIDRLRQGAVTDFLDFYWRDWHWPTFNVADIAITLGAVLILAASLPLRRRKEHVLDQS